MFNVHSINLSTSIKESMLREDFNVQQKCPSVSDMCSALEQQLLAAGMYESWHGYGNSSENLRLYVLPGTALLAMLLKTLDKQVESK